MKNVDAVLAEREAVLRKLEDIRSLRKGNLNEQWFPVVRDGKKTEELRGPYYVWSYKAGNKTVSERLTTQTDVEQARQDAANYREFRALFHELERLTEELGQTERTRATEDQAVKKGL